MSSFRILVSLEVYLSLSVLPWWSVVQCNWVWSIMSCHYVTQSVQLKTSHICSIHTQYYSYYSHYSPMWTTITDILLWIWSLLSVCLQYLLSSPLSNIQTLLLTCCPSLLTYFLSSHFPDTLMHCIPSYLCKLFRNQDCGWFRHFLIGRYQLYEIQTICN